MTFFFISRTPFKIGITKLKFKIDLPLLRCAHGDLIKESEIPVKPATSSGDMVQPI